MATINTPINPLTGLPIPMISNPKIFRGGRSLLDNVYGQSSDPSIQASPPSRFRQNNMGNYGLMNNKVVRRNPTSLDTSQFVDPNINNPYLRNNLTIPEPVNEDELLRKIPENLRQYAKIVNGQVVFEYPEELETPDMRVPGVSNQPNIEQANKGGILNVDPKPNQENIETANKGLLGTKEKPKMTMQGLLDKAVQFATSDFGMDFFMNIDDDYSTTPKSFLSRISNGYNVARANEREREKLDIEKTKANKLGGSDQGYLYTVTDPNTGNTYNATWDKKLGKAFVNIDGKRVAYSPNMFGGDKSALISTAGNISKSNLTASAFFDLRNDLNTQENSLRKMADYLKGVKDVPSGMEKLAVQFGATIQTILGDNDLTMEGLTERINKGTFSSLIGANRLEVVGGGVMTEPDALKIIEALGGDPSSLTTNPEVITALMSKIFADKYRLYNDNLEAYNIEVDSGGYSKYKKREPIVFSDSQLSALDPNKALELNLNNISDLSESQLGRIKLEDLNADQLIEYENRMKELGLL